jgi:serine/threonine protein kinase
VSEISNLLSLPMQHPNIIPPPTALICLSKNDKRICGSLFPLYKNGNLDKYAPMARSSDQSFYQTLRTWFKQLVSAVQCLVDHNTYHGDIKPDNMLISDSNDLILIDLTQTTTTMAIASPEIKDGKHQSRPQEAPGESGVSAQSILTTRRNFSDWRS